MSRPPSASNGVDPGDAAEFLAGFQRVEAEIRGVAEQELEAVNIDIPGAVATVLGVLPGLLGLRERFAELSGFDLQRFDKLGYYALALGHTHALYRAASSPSDGVTELAAELTELRDILQADAMALAKRRILDETQLAKLRGGTGYKNLAFEVAGLVRIFREHWADIQGRSALQAEELERATQRAQELVTAVGLRERSPAVVGAAAALRQRAFTLFVRAYGEARRAVSYLRWHEADSDHIAPSLFAGRRGRRASDEGADDTPSSGSVPPVAQ